MALEIERKFLLASEQWRQQVQRSISMRQAYLGGAGVSVRVRIAGDQARLNIKQAVLGSAREEFEYDIPLADGERLFELATEGRVSKIRHHVRHEGLLWEIDEFQGANAGLIVAELELSSAAQVFARPDWLGPEVTDERRYYNHALAQQPFATWEKDI
ncbi:MAG: CYTH domain-containing protein [Xanthomonadales bacterium]|nr:CYTH domain-containing protein [Xanthomonadales bacterium]